MKLQNVYIHIYHITLQRLLILVSKIVLSIHYSILFLDLFHGLWLPRWASILSVTLKTTLRLCNVKHYIMSLILCHTLKMLMSIIHFLLKLHTCVCVHMGLKMWECELVLHGNRPQSKMAHDPKYFQNPCSRTCVGMSWMHKHILRPAPEAKTHIILTSANRNTSTSTKTHTL